MPAAKTVAVKVTYGNETRRVGGDYFQQDDEWTAFCHRMRTLLQRDLVGIEEGNTYDVTYKDDDEDVVTVRSTAELREAFKAQGEVARFTVTELSQPRRGCRFAEGGCRRGGWWRRQHAAAASTAPQAPFSHPWGICRGQITRQACQMNAEAVDLMHQNKLSEAAVSLHKSVQSFPSYSPLWYNLACTEALRGNRPDALAALRAAVQNGYRDADHTMADEDLACLRSNPEFEEIVQCMRSGDTSSYVENPANYLNAQLLNFRKEGAIEDAWKTVQSGVSLGVKEPLFLYNAACIGSLLEKTDEAVNLLIDAVLNGYTDQQLIENDEDLNNVRTHQGYFTALKLIIQDLEKLRPTDDVADQPESPQVQLDTEVAVSASPSLTEVEQEMTDVANESANGSVHEWVEIDETEDKQEQPTAEQPEEVEPVVEEPARHVPAPAPEPVVAAPVEQPAVVQPPVVVTPVLPSAPVTLPAAQPGLFNWAPTWPSMPSMPFTIPTIPPLNIPAVNIPSVPLAPVPVPAPIPEVFAAPRPATPLETPRTTTLMEMGFERGSAKAALVASGNDVERAIVHLLQGQ